MFIVKFFISQSFIFVNIFLTKNIKYYNKQKKSTACGIALFIVHLLPKGVVKGQAHQIVIPVPRFIAAAVII